jgi:hypothetical protein
MAALVAPATADTIPQCGAICFHSSDPHLVDVTLIHRLQPDRQIHLKIPRSAILFVGDYKTSQYKSLPDEVISRGSWFDFAIVAPGGMPLGEAVEQYAHDRSIPLDSAITALRPQYAKVRVRLIGKGIQTDRVFSAWMPKESGDVHVKEASSFEGLPAKTTEFHARRSDGSRDTRLSEWNYIVYYPEDDSDPFNVIRCQQNSLPTYWCDYFLRLNDVVNLEINMVDFRFNGGRQFVRDRMNMVIRTYCRYDPSCGR